MGVEAELRNEYLAHHAPDNYTEFDWLYGAGAVGPPRSKSDRTVFMDETWATNMPRTTKEEAVQ
jgi:hypothetical protein